MLNLEIYSSCYSYTSQNVIVSMLKYFEITPTIIGDLPDENIIPKVNEIMKSVVIFS